MEIKKNNVILSLGSNIGDRLNYLKIARTKIDDHVGQIITSSNIYQTEAWGNKDQKDFLNQVLHVQTLMDPFKVLSKCLFIEAELKRKRREVWGPRTIDIDILYYDNRVIDELILTVPHPRLQDRRFVLQPLLDVSPKLKHPILQITTEEMIKICNDSSIVTLYNS